jgi:hypothetical protein
MIEPGACGGSDGGVMVDGEGAAGVVPDCAAAHSLKSVAEAGITMMSGRFLKRT